MKGNRIESNHSRIKIVGSNVIDGNSLTNRILMYAWH
jgi:hypothetical protein